MSRLIAACLFLLPLAAWAGFGDEVPVGSESTEASPAAEPPAGRIAGQVVLDQGGDPVPLAEVILDRPFPGRGLAAGRWRMKADAEGRFAFDKLEAGRYYVWAVHEKLTSLERARSDTAITIQDKPPGPVELRLRPGVAVTVRVKEKSSGQPIANARVRLTGSQIADDFITDREGLVRLPFRLSAESWPIDARAERYATESDDLNLESNEEHELEVLLSPGGVLAGIVRDSEGKPVFGAAVSATRGRRVLVSSARTDDEGRYRLENLPLDAQLQVAISKPNLQRRQVPVTLSRSLQSLDLVVERRPHSGPISGIVVDENDRPVAGAELIDPNSGSERLHVRTGPDGRFRLDHLYEKEFGYQLIVVAKAFSPAQEFIPRESGKDGTDVKFVLEPGRRIRGRVVDEQQQPLAGVLVFCAGRPFSQLIGLRTKTDKDGLFDLDSLPPDSPLGFSKEGYSRDGGPVAIDGQEVVTVEMSAQREIVGKVVDAETGKPIPVFSVSVSFPGRPGARAEFQARFPGAGFPVLFSRGTVYRSGEGSFKLQVSAEPRQLRVSAMGYDRASVDDVIPQPRGQPKPIEVRLQRADPATLRTFAGRLLDAEDQPVPHVQVRLIATEPTGLATAQGSRVALEWLQHDMASSQPHVLGVGEAVTDAEGHFEIGNMPGTANLELVWWGESIAPGRLLRLQRLSDDESRNLEVVLPKPARITAKVNRQHFPEADSVQIQHQSGALDLDVFRDLRLKRDQEELEVTNLPAGKYILRLLRAGPVPTGRPGRRAVQELSSVTVTVTSGETAEVEFKEPAGE